ncbi:DUF3489 domain-containing protein [Methylocystis parvus]|uniref:DUF3489 domain-containing protein n=1 Tax=Methylocystis parvus TaxID=134 RepID=UPI003C78060B
MTKLTDSQLIVLSAAAARDDGLAVAPLKMNRAGAAKVGSRLLARKLMREVKAKPGMPVWRQDGEGRPISLMITKVGRKAIGVEESDGTSGVDQPRKRTGARAAAHAPKPQGERREQESQPIEKPRAGSKQVLVISMLSRKSGATIDSLIEATGWLPHTTRAALTGLRKKGFSIERAREKDVSVYRIGGVAPAKGTTGLFPAFPFPSVIIRNRPQSGAKRRKSWAVFRV